MGPDFGADIYFSGTGNSIGGHTINVDKVGGAFNESEEATVFGVEVKNANVVQDFNEAEILLAGGPKTISVQVTGPAVVVAFWWGDDGGGPHTANADNGFVKVQEYVDLQPSGGAVQGAVWAKQVSVAGTQTVTWTATPDQGAILQLVALGSAQNGVAAPLAGTSTAAFGAVAVQPSAVVQAGTSTVAFVGASTQQYVMQSAGGASVVFGAAYVQPASVAHSGGSAAAFGSVYVHPAATAQVGTSTVVFGAGEVQASSAPLQGASTTLFGATYAQQAAVSMSATAVAAFGSGSVGQTAALFTGASTALFSIPVAALPGANVVLSVTSITPLYDVTSVAPLYDVAVVTEPFSVS